MKTTSLLRTTLLLPLAVLACAGWGQATAPAAPAPAEVAPPVLPALAWEPPPLQPFSATYQAFFKGKEAGDATMQVTH
ncbi:MAG: DUF3108 domain-containing protein, partial [Stenotrophomonas indicatrix]